MVVCYYSNKKLLSRNNTIHLNLEGLGEFGPRLLLGMLRKAGCHLYKGLPRESHVSQRTDINQMLHLKTGRRPELEQNLVISDY